MKFKSIQTRVLIFIVTLLVLVQASLFFAIDTANRKSTRAQIEQALEATAKQLHAKLEQRNQDLLMAAGLLSGDYAFKQAFAANDYATVLSVLQSHSRRIGYNVMMVLSPDLKVVANTLQPGDQGYLFALPELIAQAEGSGFGEVFAIGQIQDNYYQLAVVPLLTPEPNAWIIIGFSVDQAFVKQLQQETQSQVSVLKRLEKNAISISISTLSEGEQQLLVNKLTEQELRKGESTLLRLAKVDYVAREYGLGIDLENSLTVVLQRSLDEALAPYMQLRHIMIGIFGFGLVLSIIGGGLIAKTVTRPVKKLVEGVRKVSEGDYSHRVNIQQKDELGELARSFNNMTKGFADRGKVKNLLGGVVSSTVAEQLLSKGLELRGEERKVTVLFANIRNFSVLCETCDPKEMLAFLNDYLTRVTKVIENSGGVVDKYLGNAIMVLFGAPIHHEDDAMRAVATALEMTSIAQALSQEMIQRGASPFEIGIGINTDIVVAGNMGPNTRSNYTVIGDGVNLASRLESLAKTYGVDVLVSESTMQSVPEYFFQRLDKVRVKGKSIAIDIYQPQGIHSQVDQETTDRVMQFHKALDHYSNWEWAAAKTIFTKLAKQYPEQRLYGLYLDRIESFKTRSPKSNWDGSTVFSRI